MALKQIILGDKLRKARERLEQAQHKAEEARSQRTELETREAELTQAREEVTEETAPEEQQVLEEQINAWMEQEEALQETEAQISQEIEEAQQEIADLQQQLDEVNARGAAKPKTPENTKPEERKEHTAMNTNTRKLWFGMDHQERDGFVAREDVKAFAQRRHAAPDPHRRGGILQADQARQPPARARRGPRKRRRPDPRGRLD